MPHQFWIGVLIAHHGGAHLLQGKSQRLLGWLPGRGELSRLSFLPRLLALSLLQLKTGGRGKESWALNTSWEGVESISDQAEPCGASLHPLGRAGQCPTPSRQAPPPTSVYQNKLENREMRTCPHKNLRTNVHSSVIHNNQKVETT